MASRELVGRPLVPFFDADDNVNDTLAADASRSFESLDVDARVWNRELGYFEYPSEVATTTASSSSGGSTNGDHARKSASAPIAIPAKRNVPPSASRVLLTPAMMLSSSCPDPMPLAHERDHALLQQATGGQSKCNGGWWFRGLGWFLTICEWLYRCRCLSWPVRFHPHSSRGERDDTERISKARFKTGERASKHTRTTAE